MPKAPLAQCKRDQVLAKDIALREARVLDYFAEFHVVEHFHAQCAVSADCVIDRAPDQVESADPHVVARFGIGNFPGTMSENEKRLEEGDHHCLARPLHDHAREKDDVIGALRFGIGDGTAQGIGLEEHIGIGEEQPVSSRLLAGSPHCMCFA